MTAKAHLHSIARSLLNKLSRMSTVCGNLGATEVEELRDAWSDATSEICKGNQDSQRLVCGWWNRVVEQYSEAGRYYHTLTHLHHMLTLKNNISSHLHRPGLLLLAVFFHDIVYDPRAADNEEKSAKMFEMFSEEVGMEAGDRDKVCDMILQTKAHQPPAEEEITDLHYLLDIDMAVLGLPPHDYEKYAAGIRAEYSHYPDDAYRRGRTGVLKKMLSTGHIFSTKEMREKYEQPARTNIQEEITRLQLHGTLE